LVGLGDNRLLLLPIEEGKLNIESEGMNAFTDEAGATSVAADVNDVLAVSGSSSSAVCILSGNIRLLLVL
jgi:hypothetical protein